MLVFIYICSLLAVITMGFFQSDYEVIHHRLELVSYNRSYARNVKAELVPFNRTVRALNVSFDVLVDLPEPIIPMSFQIYKMSMNTYRELPIFLDLNYCKMRMENSFGINDMEKHSNITKCPIKKGRYYIDKYRPDESQFPPRILTGDYKLVTKIRYASDLLAEAHWYGGVKQIEKLRH